MKKILIINPHQHRKIGGIETYTRNLIQIAKKHNYDLDEIYIYPTWYSIVSKNLLKEKSKWMFGSNKYEKIPIINHLMVLGINSKFKKFDFSPYDVIIINHYHALPISYEKFKNLVQVQHLVYRFYYWQITKSKIINMFLKMLAKKTVFKKDIFMHAQNIVLFDEENAKDMQLYNSAYKIPLPYNLPIKKMDEIDFNNKKNILYVGRLNNTQKNISFLNRMVRHLNDPLIVFGEGLYKNFLNKKIQYQGIASYEEIQKAYQKAKVFVLTSNFEGFGFVLVEALSNGVPIIVRDTFPSAKFLVDNNKNGILVDSKVKPKEFAQIVNDFTKKEKWELKKYSQNTLNFANKHLKFSTFENAWLKVFSDIEQKTNKLK